MKSHRHMSQPRSKRGLALAITWLAAACQACHGGEEQASEPQSTQTPPPDGAGTGPQAGAAARAGASGTMTGTPAAGATAQAGAAASGASNAPGQMAAAGASGGPGAPGDAQPDAGAMMQPDRTTVPDAGAPDASMEGMDGMDGMDGMEATSTAGIGPAQDAPLGYGRMTTGGGDATPHSAGSLAELQAAVDAYSGHGGLVLEYTGRFDFSAIKDPCVQHTLPARKLELKNKSDITLVGAEGSAANFGIHIAADTHNIIIRNMTIGLTPGGGDSDMISLEGMSSGTPDNIWIDHNELFSSLAKCEGAGDTAFDGMIDVKKGVDSLTISYNYLHDHHKASLHGYSDSDSMPRHVTIHHNVFENIGSRTPLQRYGDSHILNNHFTKVLVSGINVRMHGYALVEGNYFQDVNNPVTSRDSDEIGYWELRDNNLATADDVAPGNRFGITWSDGNKGTVNATDWSTTAKLPEPLGYAYEADPYACVRDGLKAVAGAGKKLATLTCR